MTARTRIPSPEVREKLSRVTAADLQAEMDLRRATDVRNENRYQREQGWLDMYDRVKAVLLEFERAEGRFITVEGVIGYMGGVMEQLRKTPPPELP